nr:hypothetical protein BaRGS_026828 [Batillaria attramentaria]
MECSYRFVAESYQTMSRACYNCRTNPDDCLRPQCVPGNGFSRNIKTINRRVPGPTIQVCEGDVVTVDLENYMAMSEGITIHWHGILQKLTPHMDGVGMITQCPIQSYSSFQYRFVAVDPGTHFWHAHTGLQRGEGVFGSFIVRQPPSREPHIDEYDFDLPEHVIVVNEWQHRPLVEIYTSSQHADGQQAADAVLINGRTGENTGDITLPRSSFNVETGKRYRFRVINSGSLFCPIQISVDNHNLTLIASDGWPFEPFVVQSFDLYSAERMDFILEANQPEGSYWLRAEGLGTCDSNDLKAQAAINYVTPPNQQAQATEEPVEKAPPLSEDTPKPPQTGELFNHWPLWETYQKSLLGGSALGDSQSQLIGRDAIAPDDDSLKPEPDVQFILEFAMSLVNNTHFYDTDLYPAGSGPYTSVPSPQINRISNKLAPMPLLSQMDEIPEDQFCDSTTVGPECQTEFCECIHRLRVNFNQVVEVVLLDPFVGSGFTHPVHLHGFGYRVVAMTRVNEPMTAELFKEMDSRGEVERKLSKAPLKDTVVIPNGGYTIFRFIANNPGVWFFHCHLAFHAESGMAVALEWVLPMVLTLSLAVLALSVTSFTLWRKNKKRDAERSRWGTFPRYDSHGENSPDEIMAAASGNDGSDVTHFSYSKKQERISLTK